MGRSRGVARHSGTPTSSSIPSSGRSGAARAPIRLTRTEFAILECLMRAPGRVVTRDTLIDQVWGDRDVSDNNLDVFVRYLRQKIDAPDRPRLIHTERGLGFSVRDA